VQGSGEQGEQNAAAPKVRTAGALLLITRICETVSALRRDIDRIMRRDRGSAQSRVLATA
jgi:hypothetical protein